MGDVLQFPDTEQLVQAYLADHLPDYVAGELTVTVGVPTDWEPGASPKHLEVALDGMPRILSQVAAYCTIRLVAWSDSTSIAKDLAAAALGVLCAHPGDGVIVNARPLTGVLPARDPQTGAELAAVTARVIVRSTRLESLGS